VKLEKARQRTFAVSTVKIGKDTSDYGEAKELNPIK
jgi:hypothetical protein